MDHFGIGNALMGMAYNFFALSRATGRSTSLLESVQDGDCIIVATEEAQRYYERELKERQIIQPMTVTIRVISPSSPDALFSKGTCQGRAIFDHYWLEMFYMETLHRAIKDVDYLQRQASGFGTAHVETKLQAEMRMKFPFPPLDLG